MFENKEDVLLLKFELLALVAFPFWVGRYLNYRFLLSIKIERDREATAVRSGVRKKSF